MSYTKSTYENQIKTVLGITGGSANTRSALMYYPSNTTFNLIFLLDPTID